MKKNNTTVADKTPELAIDSSEKNLKILIWIVGLVSFFAYANTINFGFVLDDLAVIEQNKFVTSGVQGIPKILSTFYWKGYWDINAGLYRPLSLIMFAIEWSVSPNNPTIHHFVNVLLFSVSSVLLFKLLRKMLDSMSIWGSFIITILFALHPIHTEVVANIKSRDEILCFLFFILTFLQILKEKKSWKSAVLLGFTFFLCLLSKEAGVLFLPIIGIYFLLIRKETFKRTVFLVFPLIVSSFAWLFIHQSVIRSAETPPAVYTYHDNSLVACQGADRVATGVTILGKYMEKTVLPTHLNYDYSYSEIECSSFSSVSVIVTICLVLLLLTVGFTFRKKNPFFLFGVLFFLIGISLVTNIFVLIGATFAERLLYAPVLGVIIIVVTTGSYFLKEKQRTSFLNPVSLASLVIAVVFFGVTMNRNKDWESNQTLFASGAHEPTKSSRIYSNHATMLMNTGETDSLQRIGIMQDAIGYYHKALDIDTGNTDAVINMAVCYYRTNEFENSAKWTNVAIARSPADLGLHLNLADAYFQLKKLDQSAGEYTKGLDSKNASAGTFERLGLIYFNDKQYDKAISVFKKGIKRFPDFENLKMNLGNCYGIQSKFDLAIPVFEEVYRRNPANKNAISLLVMSYARMGDTEKAKEYQKLLTP